jgi:hypothetical protein
MEFHPCNKWDGFVSTNTKFNQIIWVVELEVLDGRKQNVFGQILVIFIPPSSKLIVKNMEE